VAIHHIQVQRFHAGIYQPRDLAFQIAEVAVQNAGQHRRGCCTNRLERSFRHSVESQWSMKNGGLDPLGSTEHRRKHPIDFTTVGLA
jgi:hypothetical protein